MPQKLDEEKYGDRLYVEPGETYTMMRKSDRPWESEVKPACAEKRGAWCCVTHDDSFRNNGDATSHFMRKNKKAAPCVFAWVCIEHGLEPPE